MAYLVSQEARWLTGASVRMDGGEIKGSSMQRRIQSQRNRIAVAPCFQYQDRRKTPEPLEASRLPWTQLSGMQI